MRHTGRGCSAAGRACRAWTYRIWRLQITCVTSMLVRLVHYVEDSRLEGLQLALQGWRGFVSACHTACMGAQVRVHTNTPTCMEAWMGRVGCTLAAITRASIALCSAVGGAGGAVLLMRLLSGWQGGWGVCSTAAGDVCLFGAPTFPSLHCAQTVAPDQVWSRTLPLRAGQGSQSNPFTPSYHDNCGHCPD